MLCLNFHWRLFGVPLTSAEGHIPDFKEENDKQNCDSTGNVHFNNHHFTKF